jgi:gamma-glutamylcyclotransferase (GGCT)/AIG2-like uncharacterized protein YtfP
MAMREYLFIYGTLLPEYAPNEIADTVRRLLYVGPASVQGRLYDLGEYPGVILDASSQTKISGHLFMLPQDQSVLKTLDSYEGFKPEDLNKSLFVRRWATVNLDDGRAIQSWIYVYNQDPGAAPLVSSGDYAKYKAA